MKKSFFIFMTLVALVCGSALTSCSKSNQDLIKEYQELCDEMIQAVKDGDAKKVESIGKKGDKLAEELDKRDLTDEEKQEVLKITSEMVSEMTSVAADAFGNFGF